MRGMAYDVVIPSVHLDLDIFWARTLGELGHNVYFIRGALGYDPFPFDFRSIHSAVRLIDYGDFLRMDDQRMVIFSQCAEHEEDVYTRLVAAKPRAYIVHSDGTVYGDGIHRGRRPANLLALSIQSFNYWQAEGVPNLCYFQPGCDDTTYRFTPLDTSSAPLIHCYIEKYHALFPRGYAKYRELREMLGHTAKWRLFGTDNPDGYLLSPDTLMIPDYPMCENAGSQLSAIQNSWLTFHIKEREGYGFNVVKSLMVGRPIVTLRDFIVGRTLQYLCVDGVSAIVEDSTDLPKLVKRIEWYVERPREIAALGESAARHVRQIVSPAVQLRKIDAFFRTLAR